MTLPSDILARFEAVIGGRGAHFSQLARLARLDPARHFVGADLSGVDFGPDDLTGFSFRRANLVGVDLSQASGVTLASIAEAELDAGARMPRNLRYVEALTNFWKDGCPTFVEEFGFDEFGQWFEFEIAGPDGPVTQRLRWIAPGKFLMGSPATEADRSEAEGPQHEVTIAEGVWLFDTACTQALWQAVMGKNPSKFKGADRPVETVSWNDAQKFIEKINGLVPGLNLSLPSEARWEYACRAGTASPFSFGENITPEQVNYKGKAPYGGAAKGLYRQETVPVASLPANGWGLYEMHGNVWEWCADAWHDSYEGAPSDGSVWDEAGAAYRVLRGGSWYDSAQNVRSASRSRYEPGFRNDLIGFRCARVQA